nr:MAG TPA: hypothetical protein [Caudoviricetes sp.]
MLRPAFRDTKLEFFNLKYCINNINKIIIFYFYINYIIKAIKITLAFNLTLTD